MTTDKTIYLTETGVLEVYEGKRPIEQSIDKQTMFPRNYHEIKSWLSTKKEAKLAEGELNVVKSAIVWEQQDIRISYPIDVSDIVELREEHLSPEDHFLGSLGEFGFVGFFNPPVNEEESQEDILYDLFEMRENEYSFKHILEHFTIKRR